MNCNSNIHTAQALNIALRAVQILDAMGCLVLDIRVCGRNPVMHVDREPHGVVGAWCSQERRGALVVREMVALIEGCEVRWTVQRSARLLPMRGVA